MTINDEILTLANQIANRGHKPTVALVKTKLKQKVPLPLIISTLKTWQHDPDYTSVPEEKQPSGIKKKTKGHHGIKMVLRRKFLMNFPC